MFVTQMCAWRPKTALSFPELELQRVVSCHVGVGDPVVRGCVAAAFFPALVIAF